MEALDEFLDSLPRSAKALTSLGAAVMFGAGLMAVFSGFISLPDTVASNTDRIARVESRQAEESFLLYKTVCLLTEGATLPPLEANVFCDDQAREATRGR